MLRKTTVFTQEQINILRQKFAAGMINHYEISLIEEVASETGLTVEIIKVCEIYLNNFPQKINLC